MKSPRNIALGFAMGVLICTVPPATAGDGTQGSLDPTFGSGGHATLSVGKKFGSYPSGDHAADAATDANGRTIIVGWSEKDRYGFFDWSMAAFTRDGTADRGFGRRGRLLLRSQKRTYPRRDHRATAVAIRPNRKILVGGTIDRATMADFDANFDPEGELSVNRFVFVVAQYHPNGRPDRSFGRNGMAFIPDVSHGAQIESSSHLTDIALLPDGKVVAYGLDDRERAVAYRLSTRGKLDRRFGRGGRTIVWRTESSTGDAFVEPGRMASDSQGRTIVTGERSKCSRDDNCRTEWRFTRLTPQGEIDASFGRGGRQTISWPASAQGLGWLRSEPSLAIDETGRTLATGATVTTGSAPDTTGVVIRLTAEGAMDEAFGSSGVRLLTALPGRNQNWTSAITADDRGGYVVAGSSCDASLEDSTDNWLHCSDGTVNRWTQLLTADGGVLEAWGVGGFGAIPNPTTGTGGEIIALTIHGDRLFGAWSEVWSTTNSERSSYGLFAQSR